MKKVAIVEDEQFMREELAHIFSKAGYEVFCLTEFADAAEIILVQQPGLVLLDLNLPGTSGFTICRELKARSSIPVLVLTSRNRLDDELGVLRLGADEYLTKPCHKDRLLVRAENLLRRLEGREHIIRFGGFAMDCRNYTFYAGEESIVLPENQGKIMELLMRSIKEVVTKEELCNVLWGTTEYIDENALQVNITRLKKTLGKFGLADRIETVRGIGYRLNERK